MNETIKNNRLMDRTEIRILFGVIMGALCVITTFGNIVVIYKYRKASMVGNLFIISLACADLIVGSFVMPLATLYAITENWTMTLPVCLIWLSADYTASTASILNLLTLSLDRYWSITSPLEYLGKRTKSRALFMISFAWSISLLWLVPITGWPYFFNNGIRTVPIDKCNTEYDKNILFKVTTAIVNFYLPLIAMIAINTKIFLVIHKRYRNPIMRYSSIISNEKQNDKKNRAQSFSMCSSNDDDLVNELKFNKKSFNKFNPKINETKNYNFFLINSTSSNGNEQPIRSKSVDNFNSSDNFIGQKETNSDSKCNQKKSILGDIHTMRRIPDDSVRIKRLVYRESKYTVPSVGESSSQDINERQSPLFYREKKEEKIVKLSRRLTSTTTTTTMTTTTTAHKIASRQRKGFMNKQEKAFKQLSSIVIGFTLCFLPYFIVFLIVAICENCVSNEVFTVTVWLGYFNSTMNPFLYALSNKRIKKEMSKNQHKHQHHQPTATSEYYNNKSFRRLLQNGRKSIW